MAELEIRKLKHAKYSIGQVVKTSGNPELLVYLKLKTKIKTHSLLDRLDLFGVHGNYINVSEREGYETVLNESQGVYKASFKYKKP